MYQGSPKMALRCFQSLATTALFALILFLVPAEVSAETDPLVGTWYGHDFQHEFGFLQRISRRSQSGAFSVEFRQYENCQLVWRQIEKGTWRREGTVEIVEITAVDGQRIKEPKSNNIADHYEIIEINDLGMRSRHLESGLVFTYQRVSEDFDFPICELIS